MTVTRYSVVGTPITGSLSPVLHNAVYKELGLSRVLDAYDPGSLLRFDAFLEALRLNADSGGVCVTIPYKVRAAELCNALTDTARRIGAVNYVRREADGTLTGENTDATGFREALRRELGLETEGLRVCVCGTGGVSRAIVDALRQGEAADITVVSRSGPYTYDDLLAANDTYDLLVNATPVGMTGKATVVPSDWVRASAKAVFDAVYRCATATPLVAEARKAGIPAADGRGMLIEQAIAGMKFWGIDADSELLRSIMKCALRAGCEA